jgi:hypothetical protein
MRSATSSAASHSSLYRAGDVPVEAVRFQVQRIGVGQQLGQMLGDRLAILSGDTDGNGHVLLLPGGDVMDGQ